MAEERIQRRLAAIVVADVVGYSRLMEGDEVVTLAVLKTRSRAVNDTLQANGIRSRPTCLPSPSISLRTSRIGSCTRTPRSGSPADRCGSPMSAPSSFARGKQATIFRFREE